MAGPIDPNDPPGPQSPIDPDGPWPRRSRHSDSIGA